MVPARPLFVIFLACIPLAYLYGRLSGRASGTQVSDASCITLEGTVTAINYDNDDSIKSIVVGEYLCYLSSYGTSETSPFLGAYVNVSGRPGSFSSPMNYGNFDMKSYYRVRGLSTPVYGCSLTVLSYPSGPLWKMRNSFTAARMSCVSRIKEYCPFEAGTIATLLMQDKRFLSGERKDLYSAAGIGHFLVISGLHISAIGAFVYRIILKILRKKTPASLASVTVLFLYGLFIGFGVSVIRALIMYSVRLFSHIFKRSYDMLSAMSLAGILTLLFHPLYVTDSAFVYSYMAVGIIAVYTSYFEKKKRRPAGIKFKILSAFKIPVLLSVFMLPVNLWFSFSYSLLSIPINTLLIPAAAPILVLAALAFFAGVSGLSKAAALFDFLLTLILRFFDSLCSFSLKFKAFTFSGQPVLIHIFAFYILLLLLAVYVSRSRGGRITEFCVGVLVSAVIFLGTRFYTPTVSMLYVGQGECIVLRTGTHSCIISDCGSTSEENIAEYEVIPFLKASGISRIDAVFLSHSDTDHISGITELIDLCDTSFISLGEIYINSSDGMEEVINCAFEYSVPIGLIGSGFSADYGSFSVKCLWPLSGSDITDVNASSLVLLASCDDFDILLTGDITAETESKLIPILERECPLNSIEVLKVAHHGSKTASSELFLDSLAPETAVISAGINNTYGHPHAIVTNRLSTRSIRWYCTKTSGEIDIKIYREYYAVSEYR